MLNSIFFLLERLFKKCSLWNFLLFLTLLLFPPLLSVSHSVKANEVLKEIKKKIEIITTITKRERKESQKHNIEKMHI